MLIMWFLRAWTRWGRWGTSAFGARVKGEASPLSHCRGLGNPLRGRGEKVIGDLPAIVAGAFPALGRRDGLSGLVDAGAGGVDVVAERAEHGAEEGAVFHAVAAAAGAAVDDLVEEVLRVEGDGVVGGVVEFEVLEGDGGELVAL